MKKIIVILCLLVVIISSISFVAWDKKEQENEPLYLSAFGDFVTDPDNEVVSELKQKTFDNASQKQRQNQSHERKDKANHGTRSRFLKQSDYRK